MHINSWAARMPLVSMKKSILVDLHGYLTAAVKLIGVY